MYKEKSKQESAVSSLNNRLNLLWNKGQEKEQLWYSSFMTDKNFETDQ